MPVILCVKSTDEDFVDETFGERTVGVLEDDGLDFDCDECRCLWELFLDLDDVDEDEDDVVEDEGGRCDEEWLELLFNGLNFRIVESEEGGTIGAGRSLKLADLFWAMKRYKEILKVSI